METTEDKDVRWRTIALDARGRFILHEPPCVRKTG